MSTEPTRLFLFVLEQRKCTHYQIGSLCYSTVEVNESYDVGINHAAMCNLLKSTYMHFLPYNYLSVSSFYVTLVIYRPSEFHIGKCT